MANVTRCKSRECRAPIVWTVSARSGKPMPMDEDPAPDGEFVLEERGKDLVAHHIREPGLIVNPRADRYRCHYATCPMAASWRKP